VNYGDLVWYALAVAVAVCVLGTLLLLRHAEKTQERRRQERFMVRCEVEFTGDGQKYEGISSNFSINGLFIKTEALFAPGTIIDILVHLPDGSISKLKGKVARFLRATNAKGTSLEDGIGIAIIANEPSYYRFIRSLQEAHKK